MMTQLQEIPTSTEKSSFTIALMRELMQGMTNLYGADNWDSERFGPHESSFKSFLINKLNELSPFKGLAIVRRDISDYLGNLSAIQSSIEELSSLYDLLADEASKSTLVKVVAYRIMGHTRVKLPLNTRAYWRGREYARSLIRRTESIKIRFHDWVLSHFDLREIGYPIEMFFSPGGVSSTFMLKQYEYGKSLPVIKAQDGDYVIDAGGCWGDTPLFFAHSVGSSGKVFAFEFVSENLEVFRRNLDLNPELSKRIRIVLKALWDKSGEEIAYSADGPGTSLQESKKDSSVRVSTVSIDDFVTQENLPRVDFIKMDIEGAELQALRGAEGTLRRFKPTLAISLYHRPNDLVDIPHYLESLGAGYEFFLDHFTIHHEETVLFATPRVG